MPAPFPRNVAKSLNPPLSFEPRADVAMRDYPVAGLMVTTNRLAGEQADGRFADGPTVDGEVQVLFRSTLDSGRLTGQWHRLDQSGAPPAYFREDGTKVEIEDSSSSRDYGAELRRVVPFASALQGKVVLHGSAVRSGELVAAFVGASGAGKSTLADVLVRQGLTRVADDLIPVRIRNDRVVVPWLEGDAALDLGIEAVCFLSRSASQSNLATTVLDKRDGLVALCQNSFGELRSASSWRTQFHGLGEIAERVKAISVVLPDDIDTLAAHAEQLRKLVFPALNERDSPR